MKYVLCLMAALCFVGHARLPVSPPTTGTMHLKPTASRSDLLLADAGMRMASWDIRDYGLWKTAHSPWLQVVLLADPITGKWSVLEEGCP